MRWMMWRVITARPYEAGTFKLAERHAKSQKSFRDTWQVEQSNAEIRKQSHWAEVRRKQTLAADLRVQIATQESKEHTAKAGGSLTSSTRPALCPDKPSSRV